MFPALTGIRAEESLACLNDAIFRILYPLQTEQFPSPAPVPGGECGFLNIHQCAVGALDALFILLVVHRAAKLGLPGPGNGPCIPFPPFFDLDPPEMVEDEPPPIQAQGATELYTVAPAQPEPPLKRWAHQGIEGILTVRQTDESLPKGQQKSL